MAWAGETDIGKDIVITENDIKNLIMSKASIHAACVTLMKEAGVTRHDISNIYFAGAFGNYLDKKNATVEAVGTLRYSVPFVAATRPVELESKLVKKDGNWYVQDVDTL